MPHCFQTEKTVTVGRSLHFGGKGRERERARGQENGETI
jgi:hypothetical protein